MAAKAWQGIPREHGQRLPMSVGVASSTGPVATTAVIAVDPATPRRILPDAPQRGLKPFTYCLTKKGRSFQQQVQFTSLTELVAFFWRPRLTATLTPLSHLQKPGSSSSP
ncbi:hypothetical protein GN956_G3254 [Arapaima gigas]